MDLLREYVGGPKNRYKDQKFNLDLTYITPRLIAMAFPASGLQKLYRNPIESVKDFLVQHHGHDYMIINLSGREVDETVLQNVLTYDWEDHQAPPLEMLFNVCNRMSDFLSKNYDNVVAVNCNHGKGRTGTIICCFLLYCSMFKDSELTMDFYAKKRFEKEQGYGVTQPCQVQYIRYFEQVLRNPNIRPRIITISKITFRGQNKYETLYIKAKKFDGRHIFSTKKSESKTAYHKGKSQNHTPELVLTLMEEASICGDCKLFIKTPAALGASTVASYSFNTAFIAGHSHIISFFELSPYSLRKSDSFGKDFQIELQMKDVCNKCPAELKYQEKCQKCRETLAEEQDKWKNIVNTLTKRREIEQRDRESMLGFHLKNNHLKQHSAEHDKGKQKKMQEKEGVGCFEIDLNREKNKQ